MQQLLTGQNWSVKQLHQIDPCRQQLRSDWNHINVSMYKLCCIQTIIYSANRCCVQPLFNHVRIVPSHTTSVGPVHTVLQQHIKIHKYCLSVFSRYWPPLTCQRTAKSLLLLHFLQNLARQNALTLIAVSTSLSLQAEFRLADSWLGLPLTSSLLFEYSLISEVL